MREHVVTVEGHDPRHSEAVDEAERVAHAVAMVVVHDARAVTKRDRTKRSRQRPTFGVAERDHNPKVNDIWDAFVYCSTCLSERRSWS